MLLLHIPNNSYKTYQIHIWQITSPTNFRFYCTVARDAEDFPVLECIATVLNINYGHNERTLKACKRLGDYSHFIHAINEGLDSGLNKKDAIETAIDYCINNDILADILTKHRSEVMGSILYYDEKQHMKTIRQEGYEDGYEARQQEIDELNSTYNAALASKDAEIERLKSEIKRLQK